MPDDVPLSTADGAVAAWRPAELTVVVPCFNERANVGPMAERLAIALSGIAWEAVFVDDDSPDGTAEAVREVARHDGRIRCIRRVGRRGLASAVIEGAMSSSAEFIAVIDGDLQHDETRIPALLAELRAGAEMAVASRHVEGGDAAGLADARRRMMSDAGTRLAQIMTKVKLTDPMSGFFALRRSLFDELAPRLTGQGFKILLDLMLSSPRPLRVAEVAARFHARQAGESKLDVLVVTQFAGLLFDKLTGGLIPLRFVSFAVVGGLGVLVHLAVLVAGRAAGLDFAQSQVLATIVAMAVNFWANNSVTYRAVRLRGNRLWRGLALFAVVCGLGAFANVGIARALYAAHAGWNPAGIMGAAVGGVWNYAMSATLVWRRR